MSSAPSRPPFPAAPPPSAEKRGWLWLALVLWLVPLIVIGIRVGAHPERRTVTPVYHAAAEHWQRHEPLYNGFGELNFHYLPTFIPLFQPFHALPLAAADILWRTLAMAALAVGFWRLTRRLAGGGLWRAFALITLLGLPLCLDALSNGQANAHFGAALLLAAGCLAAEEWWCAALLLSVAFALKPLGIAAAGLAFAACPRLWWRLALGISAVLLLPFLFGPAHYVQAQFAASWLDLQACSDVTENRFADLNGLLRCFGVPLAGKASLVVRAAAGAGLALFCFGIVRRRPAREKWLAWLALSAAYLMLFNPMNEVNSYVVLGPVAALWTWQFFQTGPTKAAWALVMMLATMGLLPNILHPWLGNSFALAWHPAMTLCFLALILVHVSRMRAVQAQTTAS